MSKLLSALVLLACSVALAEEPAAPAATAKIRIAGVFIKKFSVWHADLLTCAKPVGKPWMFLDCGFSTCPAFVHFEIPLELNYTNWRLSPRVTEVKIEAGKPFTMHLGGKLNKTSCLFDASFVPRAGAMYEASIDPQGNGCALSLTEIKLNEAKSEHVRVAVEGAVVKACP